MSPTPSPDVQAASLLHHSSLRILHATSFSKTSSTASLVFADVISRYLALLAQTTASYASAAGRSKPSAFDVAAALEEMGFGLDQLREWACEGGGVELSKYERLPPDESLSGEYIPALWLAESASV